MSTYIQADRAMTVTTPLGEDVLLMVALYGVEGISTLFNFQIDVIAENRKEVAFDKLLGRPVTATLAVQEESRRYFSGICSRVSQGSRDSTFTAYRLEIVPELWMLTRKVNSRIFQHINVPDILKKVLAGLDVTYELRGAFHQRDFCVQYRETDFNFACRLMEEEGIYYFFKHSESGHKMVVANTPQSHPEIPEHANIIYEGVQGGPRDEDRIQGWEKVQELRAGKHTLWDHCFELPHKHLETEKTLLESVQAGSVTHKLKVPPSDKLEIYDYPGAYAQRFDGVDKGGGDQPAELQKIFQDNERTVGIRIQEEAMPALIVKGTSNCRHFVSGHKFTLERHFNADGQYLVTSVQHAASVSGDYRSGEGGELTYENTFTCMPFSLPFRPVRRTPKPVVQGTQTAVVVGPPGEEIFTDKYGRVKVQFHWDREGKYDVDSSCWIRVATVWAGKRWGATFVPRIGQEVIVDFLEGDPDQPIVVGSVYNAEQMPAYLGKGLDGKHPHDPKVSGIKTNSTKGGEGYNELRFDDLKGKEQIFVHAQRNLDVNVHRDSMETVGGGKHLTVGGDHRESVASSKHVQVTGEMLCWIKKDNHEIVGGDVVEEFQKNHSQHVTSEYYLKARSVIIEADSHICLKVGDNFITIAAEGIAVEGKVVHINCSNSAANPSAALQCKGPENPAGADISVSGFPSVRRG